MSNIKASLATILTLLSIVSARSLSKECQIQKNNITCKCVGNQEFYLPDNYIYENTTSLKLSSCTDAKLLYPNLFESTNLTEFIIENISKQLSLDLMPGGRNFSRFELTNIKKIPAIKPHLFVNTKEIKNLVFRNVFIENFEEHFTETRAVNLLMTNVTINRVDGLNLTERGENLEIINCEFRNITRPLDFHFINVTIRNSRFEMQKQERFHVNSDNAFIDNSVFFNVTMELFSSKTITVNNTCSDGKSNLRLYSSVIKSFNNKWPTDIVHYSDKKSEVKLSWRGNNTICKASNCQCAKSNYHNGSQTIEATFILQIFLIFLTYVMSRL